MHEGRRGEGRRGGIQEVTRSVRGEEEYAKEKTLFPAAILPSPILTSTPSLSTPPLGRADALRQSMGGILSPSGHMYTAGRL